MDAQETIISVIGSNGVAAIWNEIVAMYTGRREQVPPTGKCLVEVFVAVDSDKNLKARKWRTLAADANWQGASMTLSNLEEEGFYRGDVCLPRLRPGLVVQALPYN